jgi:hypothetical protein
MAHAEYGVSTGFNMRLCNAHRGPHYEGVGAVVLPRRRERARGVQFGVVVENAHPVGGKVAWFGRPDQMRIDYVRTLCGLKVASHKQVTTFMSAASSPGAGPPVATESLDLLDLSFAAACDRTSSLSASGMIVLANETIESWGVPIDPRILSTGERMALLAAELEIDKTPLDLAQQALEARAANEGLDPLIAFAAQFAATMGLFAHAVREVVPMGTVGELVAPLDAALRADGLLT